MGKIVYEAPKPHICETPDINKHALGTVYKCDCGELWKAVQGFVRPYWSTYYFTRRERRKYRNG